MKNLFKFLSLISVLLLAACDQDFSMTQPAAKVEYHLEDYYGYGDVQGPPTMGSKGEAAMRNKGVPVVIEDVSQNNDNYQAPAEITEEKVDTAATQVYTVSDKVGPDAGRIIRNPVTSDPETVNVSAKTHTVAKGETLFSISRQYDIPILPIIVANGLEQPYAVSEGQQIKIPEGKFHTVREGETLYSISRQYGVDMSGIVKLNELKQPYNVVNGQRLQIPFPSDLPAEETAEDSSEATEPTLINNTQTNNTSSVSNNDYSKPASLRRPTGGVLGSYNPDNQQSKASQIIDTEVENTKLAERTTAEIKATAGSNQPVKDDGKFMWPVQGKVVKKFGQQGGEYNDGINISVPAGTQVKASNSGRVVYTGNSLKSYGNLVIIKHDNGLLTAYAHMNSIIVKKDQKISKGQAIGAVGSTGKVTSPQLYFAVRKGKDAKNPMNYLK